MKTFISLAFLATFCFTVTAQKSVDLKYNLENNKTYRLKYKAAQTMIQTNQGNQITTDINSEQVISLKPLKMEDDYFISEIHFDTIQVITNAPNMPPMEINSSKPGDIKSSDPSEVISSIMNRLSKTAFVVKMNYLGNIDEIMNLSQLIENIFSGLDSLSEPVGSMVKMQAENMVGENALKGMIEQMTAFLPGKEIKEGDSWKTELETSAGGIGMMITTDYKLSALNKKDAEIIGDMVIEPTSSEPMIRNGAEITMDLRGIGKINRTIDIKTGWIINGSLKQQLKGEISVSAPGYSMQIPTEINTEAEIISLTD